jgi:dihydrofolate reductase
MRIVLSDFLSLDGVVQSPGGQGEDTEGGFAHGGWSMPYFEPDTMGPAVTETMASTEALLFGRRTWQTMAAAWPDRAGDPFADRMNAIPKYVASRTLTHDDLTWPGSTVHRPTMRSARYASCEHRTVKQYRSWAAHRWPHS